MISLTKLTAWILAAALQMSGNAKPMPPKLANGIATMSMTYPLFGGDDGEQRTAAVLVVFAWKESGFNNNIVATEADGKKSYSAFMIQNCAPYSCWEIITDEQKSSFVAIEWLARSMKYCDEYPYYFSIYASGSCTNAAGRRISKERLLLAEQLVQTVK